MSKPFKCPKAYLTVDLLAALAIIAVLVSISVPSLSALTADLNIKKEAQKINSTIERHITKAARESVTYTLTLERTGLYVNTGIPNTSLMAVKTLPKKYNLSYAATNKSIHFYKQGTCSPASFELISGQRKCNFSISLRCRTTTKCTP